MKFRCGLGECRTTPVGEYPLIIAIPLYSSHFMATERKTCLTSLIRTVGNIAPACYEKQAYLDDTYVSSSTAPAGVSLVVYSAPKSLTVTAAFAARRSGAAAGLPLRSVMDRPAYF